MKLAEFKTANGISSINLFNSTKSNRLVGSVSLVTGTLMFITVDDFDQSADVYVYMADEEYQDGKQVLYWLSNKEPKAAVVVL